MTAREGVMACEALGLSKDELEKVGLGFRGLQGGQGFVWGRVSGGRTISGQLGLVSVCIWFWVAAFHNSTTG